VRKVWRQLLREGYDIARCTVARLMKAMGLQGIIRGKPIPTTISDKGAPCPLDRVNRYFFAPAPNMLWLSDFTYVATWQGVVYVAFVIDAFARRIVGWRASRTAHAGFVLDALDQALHDRRPVHRGGLVHHSDRGVPNMCRSSIPSGWLRRASSRLSGVLVIPMTTLSPKRSTVSTRPRSSIDGDRGATSKL
jgi:transposase InsO family protein